MTRPADLPPEPTPDIRASSSRATAGCCSPPASCGCSRTDCSSTVLMLYLSAAGLDDGRIGVLMTLTLLGDTAITFWLSTHADRIGRKKTLIIGALLMTGAGLAFSLTTNFFVLLSPPRSVSSAPAPAKSGRSSPSSRRPFRTRSRSANGRGSSPGITSSAICAGALGAFVGGYSVVLGRDRRERTGIDAFRYVALGLRRLRPRSRRPLLGSASHDRAVRRRPPSAGSHALRPPPLARRDRASSPRSSPSMPSAADSSSRRSSHSGSPGSYGLEEEQLGQIFLGANLLSGASALMAGTHRPPHRPHQHDGLHAPAVQHPADARALHAGRHISRERAAPAIRHLTARPSDATGIHHGRRRRR